MADQGSGVKKEFVIDSSDSARPPATLQSEPKYFSDIKPKKRVLSSVVYEDTGETAKTRKGDPVKLILKTSIYDDGVVVATTVGSDNEQYKDYLRTGVAMPSESNEPTAVHALSEGVQKELDKVLKAPNKPAAAATRSKE